MTTKCINCGTSPAYISLMGICECSNRYCKSYSADLYSLTSSTNDDITQRVTIPSSAGYNTAVTEDEDDEDMSPVYRWVTHHNDFGDI